ncbi:uncharacterized protein N7506_009548 [Penicillium brevicompactum]|uniref:uncharacterized protein n=1 Tax=Penicillium brevicompactum TaxID=5074 RepID=UPI0025415E9B|nr:uncharacterized protein N7506_009548 [Penicillium brevicompactum]KAJ5326446.1 hypothetical protein N7506_009548 [Penicillium brevicompactum]
MTKDPVGTFIPDETFDREGLSSATDEQVLLHRRVVLMNKDSRGMTRWGLLDLNVQGSVALSSNKGVVKCSALNAVIDKGRNVNFFTEFQCEMGSIGAGGKALQEKNRNWFEQCNHRWAMDWATGWGCANDLINEPHQRRTRTARQTRISDMSYEVPFLPEISHINKEIGNNSPTIETLQERFLLGALTVDYLSATLYQLQAQAQGINFNTGEFREAATHSLLDPNDRISENVLKMTDVDRSLGTLVGPRLHVHQDGRTTVKFSKCDRY